MSVTTNPQYRRRLAATTTTATTAVDCHKQVRSWRLLRTIVQLLLPSCTMIDPNDNQEDKSHRQIKPRTSSASTNSTFTGTIFGFRRGKVNFCIQATNHKTLNPIIVLLELTVPTEVLAREMRGGVLRIALESNNNDGYGSHQDSSSSSSFSLLTTPLWNMYCNGRKVGFAIKREPSKTELAALKVLTPVAEGAGVVNGEEINREKSDHMMYLRASFKRVFGSSDSESFHLVDPRGIIGQELSIFFSRSSKK